MSASPAITSPSDSVSNAWHTPALLCSAHAQQLAASAIDPTIITERGYRSIAPGAVADVRTLAGGAFSGATLRKALHQGALAFPIYRLGEPTPYTWVLRPDLPRTTSAGNRIKYEWPHNTPNVFDVLPRYKEALGDPSIPIWITEGAKKADALASVYSTAIVAVNENGVWGWRGRNAVGGKTALADLDLIAWDERAVILAPDGDVRYNKHVLMAIQRLARLLEARYNVAKILILQLPMRQNGPKTGVDDYLAQGHTAQDLEQHLTCLGTLSSMARVPFGVHPYTGARLFLPAGYDVKQQTIVRLDRHGHPQPIYSGAIFVREVGVDLHTHEQTATVSWNGRGNVHCNLTIPYAALSDTRAFSQLVGAAGAAVHPRNIKHVQAFLVEFVQENVEALPLRAHVDRLGRVGSGIVLPAGAIGFSEDVRYSGRPTIVVGQDTAAYQSTIRQAFTWPDAWALWLVLGLSLAAPAIARLRPRRNPVLYLSGASGSGKTTAMQFATGCWCNPTRHPLRLEAGRTTPAGIFQTLDHLNGLPALVDEAHTIADPKRLELACYAFANGQHYTVGSVEGKARGGSDLSGTLLLAGEAVPVFKHAGARLRVLWADAGTWLLLGVEPRSAVGLARAQLLEAAWEGGAGLFGLEATRRIWGDWPAFVRNVRAVEADPALASLHAWRTPLAIAAAALIVAYVVADAHSAAPGFEYMLDHWAKMLTTGHEDTDPATEAWEGLMTLLIQGRKADDGRFDQAANILVPATWEWIEADRGGGMIACRKIGDDYWRVMTRTPQFVERIGAQAVQLYGQSWLKRGWVRPAKDGKSTDYQRVYGRGEEASARVLCIPLSMLEQWSA
jgi:hypothetical protein